MRYDFLKDYPMRFLRQKVIDDYIVGFCCHDARLVIGLDGPQHYQQENEEKDNIRTEKLESRGLTVIHISDIDIDRNFEGVSRYIEGILNHRKKTSVKRSFLFRASLFVSTMFENENPSALRRDFYQLGSSPAVAMSRRTCAARSG